MTQNTKVTNSKNQKKKKNPHVFFLSSCNEIFLACQICKNFDGKLGFSSSMHMVLRASHDQCANKRRTVFWVEGAFETKANGEWTSIVLLLLSQQLSEYFVEMDTNKMERNRDGIKNLRIGGAATDSKGLFRRVTVGGPHQPLEGGGGVTLSILL